MRLTHLRLSGFKSFVDPTVLEVNRSLVGIVGPNGCGKSNVIDAVRWVLGESRASELRGEQMQDVIFNGSEARRPAGRASVEMQFDNSQGRLAGPWGRYGELTVKRVLGRDGQSLYAINGQSVRRKDVHDLFMGTGLGPRAYAIIGQGMIARVIESRPEELRVFLEEAAGISKYRERRRETENRLEDARGNLSRVDDIRQELSQRVVQLAAQSEVARRYQDLADRRQSRQDLLLAIRDQEASQSASDARTKVDELSVRIGSLEQEILRLEALRPSAQALLEQRQQDQQRVQSAAYAAASAVLKEEAERSAAQSRLAELERQQVELDLQIQRLLSEFEALASQQAQLQQECADRMAAHEAAQAERSSAQAVLYPAQQRLEQCRQEVTEAKARAASAEAELRGFKSRLQDHHQRVLQLERRLEQVRAEQAAQVPFDEQLVHDAQAELMEAEARLQQCRLHDAQTRNGLVAAEQSREAARQALAAETSLLQRLRAELQAQSALLGRLASRDTAGDWLQGLEQAGLALGGQGWRVAGPLWSLIQVREGRRLLVEAALGDLLRAPVLVAPDGAGEVSVGRLMDWIRAHPPKTTLRLILAATQSPIASTPLEGLAQAIEGQGTAPDWARQALAGVLHETGDQEASSGFAVSDSWRVTPEGHLLRRDRLQINGSSDSAGDGLLELQARVQGLESAVAAAGQRQAEAQEAAQQAERSHQLSRTEQEQSQKQLQIEQASHHRLELRLRDLLRDQERAEARLAELMSTEAAALTDLNQANSRSAGLDEQAQKANERSRQTAEQLVTASADLQAAEQSAREASQAANLARDRVADQANQLRSAEERLRRAADQQGHLQTRLDDLSRRRGQLQDDTRAVEQRLRQSSLEALQAAQQQADLDLSSAARQTQLAADALREADEQRLQLQQSLRPLLDARSAAEKQLATAESVLAGIAEQSEEQLQRVRQVQASWPNQLLPPDLPAPSSLQSEVNRLGRDLEALGPVNLAALAELEQARARQDFMDAQAQDLAEAVQALEDAIRRIDRESRALLQDTFDAVNSNFSKLFPVLFGGGDARLVLTGEEILDAGVQVMAQPPGKRNSTIHLLSGGEKALTATALVFSLFQLNPAPFCLLDEVDAPLDDPNTERLCRLIRDMSLNTQFIFITHNKIAMEIAEHLVGVTMAEKGVSRLVAVDLQAASSLVDGSEGAA